MTLFGPIRTTGPYKSKSSWTTLHCRRRRTCVVIQKSETAAYQGPGIALRGDKKRLQMAQKRMYAKAMEAAMKTRLEENQETGNEIVGIIV